MWQCRHDVNACIHLVGLTSHYVAQRGKIAENTVYACALLSTHTNTHGTKGKKGTISRMSDQANTKYRINKADSGAAPSLFGHLLSVVQSSSKVQCHTIKQRLKLSRMEAHLFGIHLSNANDLMSNIFCLVTTINSHACFTII